MHHDYSAIKRVVDVRSSVGYVLHPLVPEVWRFSEDNVEGVITYMYIYIYILYSPIYIAKGGIAELLILDASKQAVYSVRLH